jgi:hypothetical protein
VVPAEFKFVYVCAVRRALRAKGFSPHEASSGSRVRRVLRAGGLPPTTPERNSPLPPQKDTGLALPGTSSPLRPGTSSPRNGMSSPKGRALRCARFARAIIFVLAPLALSKAP